MKQIHRLPLAVALAAFVAVPAHAQALEVAKGAAQRRRWVVRHGVRHGKAMRKHTER